MASSIKIKKPLSLSNQIIIGLILGGLTGLFLGEYAYPFDYAGKAFIGLLQMTVLPYIVFSLMMNIGRLSLESGKKLIFIGLKVMAVLIAFGLINLLILPLAFPDWESSNFFSPSFNQASTQIDLISLYIPSNPFYSLSANHVPAVVLFSIIIGIGLMKVPNKEGFLKSLEVVTNALNQVNKIIIKITPIGVFAIAAATVGTVSWEQLGKLQTFIIIYTVVVIIMTFWVLPALIAAVTPFKYHEIFKYTRATLLTIFATGKIIVVLPQLINNLDELFKSKHLDTKETEMATDILMPLAYPFPNLGTLIILIFVPFAGWYSGEAIGLDQMPIFILSSFMSSFIAPITGIPFMLETLDISKDMFQLFFVSSVYTDRIRVVLGAMHLIALTLIATSIYQNLFIKNIKKLVSWGAITVLLYIVSITGVKYYLTYATKDTYNYDQLIFKIPPRFESSTKYSELKTASPNPTKIRGWQSRLSRIRSTKVLRVGFIENYLPFSYRNDQGELIGYDIEMAKMLGESLNASVVFVPVDLQRIGSELNKDYYDIVMSGVPLSSNLVEKVDVSHSYMDLSLALLTKAQTDNLKNFDNASQMDSIRIAYVSRQEFITLIQSFLPNIIPVKIKSPREYIEADTAIADGLITSAETGSYHSLLNPDYRVVNPLPEHITVPVVYPVGFESEEFVSYLNNWIIVITKQGVLDKLYDHWILGKQVTMPKQNWSVIKDVLHWVDE